VTFAALVLAAPIAGAADWSSTNVQLLHGDNYADDFGIDDKEKTIFTLEHANGWGYGDNFFFVDVSNPTAAGTAHYAEFSPRLSFGKMTGKDLSFAFVQDVLLAGTWEMGDGVRAYLYGVGFALKIPKFAFADINLYARESRRDFVSENTDTGWQVTIDWLLPFEIGGVKFAFEGFADYAAGEDGGSAPKEDNLLTAPRLLLDVGQFWGAAGKLQAGVEYQIWRNKFGIKDVDEDVAQVMVKWIM
jgi:nucleoside-specific outer membrane channel protein Tsx